jgi:hypothetical protein
MNIAVCIDADGNWVAFGRSDNSGTENRGVAQLLAAKTLTAPGRTLFITATIARELVDV